MEFNFLAEQQLTLYGNIFLSIFTLTFIIFFVTLYLLSKEKNTFTSGLLFYINLIIGALSFAGAVILSNYDVYDPEFTADIFKFVQIACYIIYTVIALLILTAVTMYKKHAK